MVFFGRRAIRKFPFGHGWDYRKKEVSGSELNWTSRWDGRNKPIPECSMKEEGGVCGKGATHCRFIICICVCVSYGMGSNFLERLHVVSTKNKLEYLLKVTEWLLCYKKERLWKDFFFSFMVAASFSNFFPENSRCSNTAGVVSEYFFICSFPPLMDFFIMCTSLLSLGKTTEIMRTFLHIWLCTCNVLLTVVGGNKACFQNIIKQHKRSVSLSGIKLPCVLPWCSGLSNQDKRIFLVAAASLIFMGIELMHIVLL